MPERTPIGGMRASDFADLREQRPLSDLRADAGGYVRFDCPRAGKLKLETMLTRFRPGAGLVNILNALAPKDCPKTEPNPSGIRSCAWRYRDLT
jgi:hypothetical protein